KKSGRRVIWTLHDCWSFTGHCSHFEYVGCTKWMNGCQNCEQLSEYPKSMKDNSEKNYHEKMELFTGLPNMTIVTPSEWLKQRVLQSFLKEYHTVVVPTGIDLSSFKPVKEERSKDNIIFRLKNKYMLRGKRVILGVANPWRERKGLTQFINLSKVISDKYAIVLAGLSEDQISSLPPAIVGIKKTESLKELAALYSMADVYVNLTLEDTFPTTNIEALACGTPVITYKTGGSPESITERTGIIVEKNSVQGIVAALDKIEHAGNESYTLDDCLMQAAKYDKEVRYMEYIEEVYEGV
nr:glycosyltransferase [Lachnospiraceae bacterium]